MLKVIFITMRTNAVDTVVSDFATLKGAERALKEFNGMKGGEYGAVFLAKRLYDYEEELKIAKMRTDANAQ